MSAASLQEGHTECSESMFSTEDTIVAISTALGRGAIGVVRLSGPEATIIASQLTGGTERFEPRRATFATLLPRQRKTSVPTRNGQTSAPRGVSVAVRDRVIVTLFSAPHSYTGDDVIEISAHGSPVVLQSIVQAALDLGARLAEPGEFTLRAFLNGKLDLVQAEAIRDLIEAVTPLQARAAFDQLEGTLTAKIRELDSALFDLIARLEASLDFPDEGYHFVQREAATEEIRRISRAVESMLADADRARIVREGAQVAIVGTPNVGKSSLFNVLLNAHRAIVTPIPGTTRDLVSERADIRGIATALIDTAGIRETCDVVEQEGVARARGVLDVADLTLVVLDRSRPLQPDDRNLLETTRRRRRLVVVNKVDLPAAWLTTNSEDDINAEVSVRSGAGVETLIDRMAESLGAGIETRDQPIVGNVRHASLLRAAGDALTRAANAIGGISGGVSEEYVLADLQEAAARFQEITGQRTTEDLLTHIFSKFCIGK